MLLKKKKLSGVTTLFTPQVRSMHPSHYWLKRNMPKFPFRAIIRLGSTTTTQEAYPTKTPQQIARIKEINTVEGVKNSSSKLLMKRCFTAANVKTANWFYSTSPNDITQWCSDKYPIIAKSHYGSRGNGNTKLNTQQELETWMRGKTLSNYIFEKFYTYSKEYRIHVSKNGCFYTCRKLLKNDTPESETWHRHDENSVWILEDNPKFMKPSTWDLIVQDCIKAKDALGLDICAFDVKTQGSSKENPEWIILESCSAPSFGEITKVKYREEIIKLLSE